MQSNSNNSGLKAIVVVLSLLLLGSLAYIYKLSTDNEKEVMELTTEKEDLASDLKAKIAELDKMSSENTALKGDIEAQKAEMEKLLAEVEKSKGDASSMARYKNEYFRLKKEMDNLVAENELLKEQNLALTSSLDSTNVVLSSSRQFADTLISQNDNLVKTIEKGQKLSVLNLNVLAVKEKRSGREVETDKASRANKLKVSFLIAENQIAQSGERQYYVQIIDSKNNVLGDKKSIAIGEKELTYSFIETVQYQNKTVKVNRELTGDDFEAGTYFVYVFDVNGENVSKTSFDLR